MRVWAWALFSQLRYSLCGNPFIELHMVCCVDVCVCVLGIWALRIDINRFNSTVFRLYPTHHHHSFLFCSSGSLYFPFFNYINAFIHFCMAGSECRPQKLPHLNVNYNTEAKLMTFFDHSVPLKHSIGFYTYSKNRTLVTIFTNQHIFLINLILLRTWSPFPNNFSSA